jgi:hypothetical protein
MFLLFPFRLVFRIATLAFMTAILAMFLTVTLTRHVVSGIFTSALIVLSQNEMIIAKLAAEASEGRGFNSLLSVLRLYAFG